MHLPIEFKHAPGAITILLMVKRISYPFNIFSRFRTDDDLQVHLPAANYRVHFDVHENIVLLTVSRFSLEGSGPGGIRVSMPRNRTF